MLGDFATDLHHAARTLRKNPGFTITALITLALAIGANSAIFTLANAFLLASMPVSHPERLLEVSTLDLNGEKGRLSIPAFQLIQQEAGIFTSALAWHGGSVQNLEMNGMPFAGSVDGIAGDYYATLGIHPALGREYPSGMETVSEEFNLILRPERMLTLLTSFFGAVGLLLAAVGLYGLLSYTISRRTGEIGIRVALGATPSAIVALVLRDVAVLVAIGLAAGLAIAFAGARAIAAFLYGLSSHDPATLVLSAGVLIFVATMASLVPAIRAIRIDPLTALHYE